jgi:hypothetical protein
LRVAEARRRADCKSPQNCATQLQQPLIAMHDSTSAGEQISLFGIMQNDHLSAPLPVPNGGSARGYQELFTPLAIPAAAEQTRPGPYIYAARRLA